MNSRMSAAILGLSACNGLVADALAQSTVRASLSSTGAQANFYCLNASVSPDGRYVAFESSSSNLVPGDTNGFGDVFVRDLQSGTTERVSLTAAGAQGNQTSVDPSTSADGRFVVFHSLASNLVAGDTNGVGDIFVRDRVNATNERVSVNSAGVQANNGCIFPAISPDGRFVAFQGAASNLVAGDTNSTWDIFVRDRLLGTTERVSVASSGAQANEASEGLSISADGRFVAFGSRASNLIAAGTSFQNHIYLRDRLSATTELLSVGVGAESNGASTHPSISADGHFVAFESGASNLGGLDTNGTVDVFVRDLLSGTTERVSTPAGGGQANAHSVYPSISGDGRFVVFASAASNLIVGDMNASLDMFVRDRLSGTMERMTVSTGGVEANGHSYFCSISTDGRVIAFESEATNLVASDTNGVSDVFARDRGAPPPLAFCFGDGSGTLCPCGTGASGNGCPSSVNANGANLSGTGSASIAGDTFVLAGVGMPSSTALYFQGTTQVNGGLGSVFGDGLRCAGGTIIRLGIKTNTAGASQYPTAGDLSISVKGLNSAGAVRTYQVWYRNAAAFCNPEAFNLTNGVQMTWVS